MAINGIGSYGNYFDYYQTVSQIRLQQALSKNSRIQETVQAVQEVQRVPKVSSYYQDTGLNFVSSYQSTMADVMDSANSLRAANSGSAINQLEAVSSDSDVADVSLRYGARTSKNLSVNVEALAQAQMNLSTGVKGSGQTTSNMDFTITGKNQSVSVKVDQFDADGNAKTNYAMLKEAAKQINEAEAGIQASVVDEDGISSLKLEAKATGTSGAFEVSGTMGAAAGAEKAETEAADAKYTVKSSNMARSYTSQTNDVTLDAGRISAKLKSVGETEVSLQPDTDKVVSSMSDLVKNYNDAISFLSDNASRGSGVSTQLNRIQSNLGTDSVLNRIGLSKEKDGTLSLDETKLRTSLEEEPELTRNLISGTGGIAQNIFNKASSAMRTNANSLVDYDLQNAETQSIFNPLQYIGSYSRYGTMNMNHTATLGLLMNYLV